MRGRSPDGSARAGYPCAPRRSRPHSAPLRVPSYRFLFFGLSDVLIPGAHVERHPKRVVSLAGIAALAAAAADVALVLAIVLVAVEAPALIELKAPRAAPGPARDEALMPFVEHDLAALAFVVDAVADGACHEGSLSLLGGSPSKGQPWRARCVLPTNSAQRSAVYQLSFSCGRRSQATTKRGQSPAPVRRPSTQTKLPFSGCVAARLLPPKPVMQSQPSIFTRTSRQERACTPSTCAYRHPER